MVGFAGSAMPDLRFLAPHIPIVIWDEADADQRAALVVNCGGSDIAAPVLRLNAQLEGGGCRCFLAFATPHGSDGRLVLKDAQETILFSSDAPFRERDSDTDGSLDLGYMLSGLTDAGRVRLIRFLLHSCRTAFGLSTHVAYASNMKRLAEELSLQPGSLDPCAYLTRNLVLVAGTLPASIGADVKALAIGNESVHETPVTPWIDVTSAGGTMNQPLLMAVGKVALSQDACIVLTGAAGVAIRRVRMVGQTIDPIVSWLISYQPESPIYRNYALQCLTRLGQADPSAVSAIREILALGENSVADCLEKKDLQFSPECAIAAGENVFLCGRVMDPHDLIRAVKIRIGDWSVAIDRQSLLTYAASDFAAENFDRKRGSNFAVLARGSGRPPTFGTAQIALQLKSGAMIEISQLAMPHSGEAARQRMLEAVPSAKVTDRQLEDVFAPGLKALDDSEENLPRLSGDIVNIGPQPNYPGASVIIPLLGDRGMLATWTSAIAAGIVDGFKNELIFVQPAATDLDLTERALGNLYRRSGMGAKLIRTVEFASGQDQRNVGALAASCDRLVFLGLSCIPCGKNTLPALLSVLDEGGRAGLVGGAVLDPNGSIIHAGYMPPKDGWIGTAYAGFPAIELVRIAQRNVFACSSEFFALDRAVFELIGGFSSKYLTGAWGDADFAQRIYGLGKTVTFEHRARAARFQLTRPSLQYDENLARRIDAWRFSKEWPGEAVSLSAEAFVADGSKTIQPDDAPRARGGNARWAA